MTPAPNEPSKSDMDNSESTDGGATGAEGMRKRAGADASSEAASNTNGSEAGAHDHGHNHGHDHGSGAKKRKKPWFIRITTAWWFKLLPWTVVSVTPVAAFLAIPTITKHRYEQGTFTYFCVIFWGMWNALMLVYNFVMASLTEAGSVDKNYFAPHSPVTGKYLMVPPERPKSKVAEKKNKIAALAKEEGIEMADLSAEKLRDNNVLDEYDIKLFYAPRFCHICQLWKPPRSHHDSVTGKVYLRMDHFCPFTGNVIAVRNHGHFILMYFYAVIGLLYSLFHIAMILWTHTSVAKERNSWFSLFVSPQVTPQRNEAGSINLLEMLSFGERRYDSANIDLYNTAMFYFGQTLVQTLTAYRLEGSVMLAAAAIAVVENIYTLLGFFFTAFICFTIVFVFIVGACGGPVFYFIYNNVTALEYNVVRLNEYIEIAPQVYCPIGLQFYKQNTLLENYKQILGDNWLWRLILPVRGRIDVFRYGYEPPVSHEGVRQLHYRIQQFMSEGVQQPIRSYDELGITPTAMDLGDQDKDRVAAVDPETKQGSV
jgi:hypothetical protein